MAKTTNETDETLPSSGDVTPDPCAVARVLLTLDAGLLARVDHEVAVLARAARALARKERLPRRDVRAVTRTAVLQDLIRESLDTRALARGEAIPMAEPASPFETTETESGAIALMDAHPDEPASANDFAERDPLSFDPAPIPNVDPHAIQSAAFPGVVVGTLAAMSGFGISDAHEGEAAISVSDSERVRDGERCRAIHDQLDARPTVLLRPMGVRKT